jgi:hypothetical protein
MRVADMKILRVGYTVEILGFIENILLKGKFEIILCTIKKKLA